MKRISSLIRSLRHTAGQRAVHAFVGQNSFELSARHSPKSFRVGLIKPTSPTSSPHQPPSPLPFPPKIPQATATSSVGARQNPNPSPPPPPLEPKAEDSPSAAPASSMGREKARRLSGGRHFRQRLVLATLTSTAVTMEDIRSGDAAPGLRPHEVSLLRLLDKISDHHTIDLNETGTKLRYRPGVITGGKGLEHDCGVHRGIGYFLEPLILLGLFARAPISIRLKGITNDTKDPSVDTFRMSTLHMLKHFGVPIEGLELKIDSRGCPPLGGGEVFLRVPNINSTLTVANWVDEGMVKRIRGVSFSTRVSSQIERDIIYAARGIFNRFIPDVHIFTDHRSGPSGGRSAGYGVSLVAETTTGCLLSVDATVSYPNVNDMNGDSERPELMLPDDLGVQAASMLLEKVAQGGVVDSTHQGLLFILCALCPPDVSKVRVGQLMPYAIETLRNIRDFLDVKFIIKPDPNSNTVTLKCVGAGVKNLARKIS